MFKKIIVAAVLIAFISIQLGYTLQCYDCQNPTGCKNPKVVTCDEKAGNATSIALATYYAGVSNATHTNFECLHWNATENNNVLEMKGCIYSHVGACDLNPLPEHGSLVKNNCTKCGGNLCNGRSSAGTFSTGFFSLMGTTIAVLIAKVTVF